MIFILKILDVNENVCHVCKAEYDDDENQDAWIGCDSDADVCGRWNSLLVCWI